MCNVGYRRKTLMTSALPNVLHRITTNRWLLRNS